jgi:hypothetical protein
VLSFPVKIRIQPRRSPILQSFRNIRGSSFFASIPFKIRTYAPPLLQPLYNEHLHHPIVSADFKRLTIIQNPPQPLWNQHLQALPVSIANAGFITLLFATLTRQAINNSFRIRTYKKDRGWGSSNPIGATAKTDCTHTTSYSRRRDSLCRYPLCLVPGKSSHHIHRPPGNQKLPPRVHNGYTIPVRSRQEAP